ncbi:MAG: tetratricopeptide repeat protein [Nitrosomonadales bacterium]|nr:tetratricopeptide repeat protein [Nitrosomonadales bacterium]
MQATLPDSLLSSLSKLVATQTGLHFPPERWGDLERGIAAAAPDFNFPDVESCAQWLLSAPLTRRMNEVLASHLSVGETYFFREKLGLKILEEQILLQLLQSRRQNERRLRIWSAGCSTGEEAYTIAILLDRLIPDLKEWNVTILATDFNPKFLRKAAQGVYGEWSFRDAPGWLREKYFMRKKDGRFEIHPRIRKMVTFSYLNFADDVYPSLTNNTSAMDIILCRNVLMYFTAQRAKQVAGNFYRALVDGGWLIVSPTEASNALFSPFAPVEFPGAVLYRKTADVRSQPLVVGYPVLPLFEAAEAAPPLPPVVPAEPAPAILPVLPNEATPAANLSAGQAGQAQARQADDRGMPSRMARNCANQGRLAEALEWCEQAIAADRLDPAHHYLLATILQEQGRHDTAIQSLMRALYLDPDFVLAHFALGNLHQSQGHYRQAQRHFENTLLLLRQHPPEETLPEADGLTAGRLAEIAVALLESLPQPAVAVA